MNVYKIAAKVFAIIGILISVDILIFSIYMFLFGAFDLYYIHNINTSNLLWIALIVYGTYALTISIGSLVVICRNLNEPLVI